MPTLILLRHGRSDWNEKNLFTGWVDVDLTDKGRAEAARAGELIKEQDRQPEQEPERYEPAGDATAHGSGRMFAKRGAYWRLVVEHVLGDAAHVPAGSEREQSRGISAALGAGHDRLEPPTTDKSDEHRKAHLDAALALVDGTTAGFMVETVQGEGGVTAGSADFIRGLRAAADERGLLLVLDEVQCGYARTGKMWAYEHYGITPDIMAVAKGIGAGFPLGACLATEEAAKGMVIGTHGSTYGGNPLAMAAGEAVLDVIQGDGFLDHVAAMGDRLRAALEQMIPNHDGLFDAGIRGKGLMLGVKLKEPAEARSFVAHLRDNHGLLTVAAGENVVRVLPPLVIEQAHIDEFVQKMSDGARSFAA